MNAQPQHPRPSENIARPRAFYLPRLATEYYQGDAVVLWTLTVFDRATGWLTGSFHSRFRELMLHAAARENLLCPMYCLMPDHLHLVWMGLRPDSDQKNGMAFLRTYLKPELAPAKFQAQAHDEVLRAEQRRRNAFAKVCFYLAANPIRAELAAKPEEWLFTGCVIPGYPELNPLAGDYWPKLWRIYAKLLQPDAGNLKRPPVGDDVRRLKNEMTKEKPDIGDEETRETSESRHLASYKEDGRSRRKEALT